MAPVGRNDRTVVELVIAGILAWAAVVPAADG